MSDVASNLEDSLTSRATRGVWTSVACSLCLTGLLVLFSLLKHHQKLILINEHADVWLWAAVAQLACLLLILSSMRSSSSWHARLLIMLPPWLTWGAVAIIVFGDFDAVAYWGLEALIGLLTAIGWGVLISGALIVPVWIVLNVKHRRPGWNSSLKWMKIWFAVTVFLLPVELVARVLLPEVPLVEANLELPQTYPDPEPGVFQISAIGGSTMVGFPYQPRVGIPQFLVAFLQKSFPDRIIHASNMARSGENFRQAASKLRQLKSRPQLLLVYSGQNEYFHDQPDVPEVVRLPRRFFGPWFDWSAAYRLASSVVPQGRAQFWTRLPTGRSLLYESVFTAEVRHERVLLFRKHYSQLAEHCRQHGIATIWFVPAANEGVLPPNRSICSRTLSLREEEQLTRQFFDIRQQIETATGDSALLSEIRTQLTELDARFPGVAEIHFWLGFVQRELGDYDAARNSFFQARNLDAAPSHITHDYQEAIREVAAEYGIELLDAEEILRPLSPVGLLDTSVIIDCVHPSIRGHEALARATARSATIKKLFNIPDDTVVDSLNYVELLEHVGFTRDDLALAYRRMEHALQELGRYRALDHGHDRDAQQFLEWSEQLTAGSINPGEAGTEGLDEDARPGVQFSHP